MTSSEAARQRPRAVDVVGAFDDQRRLGDPAHDPPDGLHSDRGGDQIVVVRGHRPVAGRDTGGEELANEAEKIEKMTDASPKKSRELIKSIIEARYTAPS